MGASYVGCFAPAALRVQRGQGANAEKNGVPHGHARRASGRCVHDEIEEDAPYVACVNHAPLSVLDRSYGRRPPHMPARWATTARARKMRWPVNRGVPSADRQGKAR